MKQCSLYEWMVTTKSLEIMTIASQVENKLNKPVMSVVKKTTRTYSDREVWASLNKTQVECARCLEGVQNVKSGLKKWNLTFSQHFSFTKKINKIGSGHFGRSDGDDHQFFFYLWDLTSTMYSILHTTRCEGNGLTEVTNDYSRPPSTVISSP